MFLTGFPFAETGGQQKDEEYRPPLKGVTPHGVGRCPKGRGDRSVRGEPPLGGGEVFREIFYAMDDLQKPLSQCCALPAPLSGEPLLFLLFVMENLRTQLAVSLQNESRYFIT